MFNLLQHIGAHGSQGEKRQGRGRVGSGTPQRDHEVDRPIDSEVDSELVITRLTIIYRIHTRVLCRTRENKTKTAVNDTPTGV